jgi:hypothetical protein
MLSAVLPMLLLPLFLQNSNLVLRADRSLIDRRARGEATGMFPSASAQLAWCGWPLRFLFFGVALLAFCRWSPASTAEHDARGNASCGETAVAALADWQRRIVAGCWRVAPLFSES